MKGLGQDFKTMKQVDGDLCHHCMLQSIVYKILGIIEVPVLSVLPISSKSREYVVYFFLVGEYHFYRVP